MPRFAWAPAALALVLLSAFLVCSPSTADVIGIEADSVRFDPDGDRLEASGQAHLSYRDLELRADRLTADRASGLVQASGSLALVQAGRKLEGDLLEYNFRTAEGVLEKARVVEQGVIVGGEKLEFSPEKLVAHHAYFTTCDRPHPHYELSAHQISLTAAKGEPGGSPKSGVLSLNRARVSYRGRGLFTLPRYSVSIGDLGKPGGAPFPVSGFSRDDGPYLSLTYALGRPEDATAADFSYRYTTFRGIRGHLRLRRTAGPLELTGGYVRREDESDRELQADDLESSLANVMVNREPEYGVRLPGVALTRVLRLRAEWLQGSYSERERGEVAARASADRTSASAVLSVVPYALSPKATLSHAVGWRRSTYSPGDDFTVKFYRHALDLDVNPRVDLSLSYITRRGSGETPFLFDGIDAAREIQAGLRYRLNPRWRFRVFDAFDLEERRARDISFSVTRTIHCLDYTVGWRKARGNFFFGIGLAPPSSE